MKDFSHFFCGLNDWSVRNVPVCLPRTKMNTAYVHSQIKFTDNYFKKTMDATGHYTIVNDDMTMPSRSRHESLLSVMRCERSRVCGHCLTAFEIRFCRMRDINLRQYKSAGSSQSIGLLPHHVPNNERMQLNPSRIRMASCDDYSSHTLTK